MLGTLGLLFIKKEQRNIRTFLLFGLIGVLADFDIIFNQNAGLLAHRGLTHTIIPASIILGIFTLIIFKNFWAGFTAHALHFMADMIDRGGVSIIPYVKVDLTLIHDPHTSLLISSALGVLIAVFWIIYIYYTKGEASEQ